MITVSCFQDPTAETLKLPGWLGTLCFFLRGKPSSLLGSEALTLPCSDTALAQDQLRSQSALCSDASFPGVSGCYGARNTPLFLSVSGGNC